jgi:ribosomal protein L30E
MRGAIKASVAGAGKIVLPARPASSLVNQELSAAAFLAGVTVPKTSISQQNRGEKCRRIARLTNPGRNCLSFERVRRSAT